MKGLHKNMNIHRSFIFNRCYHMLSEVIICSSLLNSHFYMKRGKREAKFVSKFKSFAQLLSILPPTESTESVFSHVFLGFFLNKSWTIGQDSTSFNYSFHSVSFSFIWHLFSKQTLTQICCNEKSCT